MCTNYVAPGEDPGLSELRIGSFVDLYRWHPWKPEIYQDYDAPIVGYVDGQFKPPIVRSTMNVRDDSDGDKVETCSQCRKCL
ncbi:hypothetical protein [Burkholderia vietnamiensis]|uniref:hypothetical protein n=1 Tax=Burkholderia vietnamiensis TaxID=60552 RepID=UPI003F50D52A